MTAIDVTSGEMLFVSSGGAATNIAISAGGYTTLLSGGDATGGVTFGGADISFTVASGGILTAPLTGFGATDALTLGAINYGMDTSFTYSGTTANGTLSVTDGTNTESAQFVGDYSSANFHDGAAVGGGTVITYG